jgi:hypothetical protein
LWDVLQAAGFVPTERQLATFQNKCRQLGKDWRVELDKYDTAESFSAGLDQLFKAVKAQADSQPATVKQANYLLYLGVAKKDLKKYRTVKEASEMIKELQAIRGPNAEAPTQKQLDFLEELRYKGASPSSKGRASQIIGLLLQAKSVSRFLARAHSLRLTEVQIKRFEEFLATVPKQLEAEQQ